MVPVNLIDRERELVRAALRLARSEGESEPGSPGWVQQVLEEVNVTHRRSVSMLRDAYIAAADEVGIHVSVRETMPKPRKR